MTHLFFGMVANMVLASVCFGIWRKSFAAAFFLLATFVAVFDFVLLVVAADRAV